MDKSWMLNPTAISQARNCIDIIQEELGVRLKLSHPQFLSLIFDYIELTASRELADAYNVLVSHAASDLPKAVIEEPKPTVSNDFLELNPDFLEKTSEELAADQQEMIEYRGKKYPRYSGGSEFKGLYRGQARYS